MKEDSMEFQNQLFFISLQIMSITQDVHCLFCSGKECIIKTWLDFQFEWHLSSYSWWITEWTEGNRRGVEIKQEICFTRGYNNLTWLGGPVTYSKCNKKQTYLNLPHESSPVVHTHLWIEVGFKWLLKLMLILNITGKFSQIDASLWSTEKKRNKAQNFTGFLMLHFVWPQFWPQLRNYCWMESKGWMTFLLLMSFSTGCSALFPLEDIKKSSY